MYLELHGQVSVHDLNYRNFILKFEYSYMEFYLTSLIWFNCTFTGFSSQRITPMIQFCSSVCVCEKVCQNRVAQFILRSAIVRLDSHVVLSPKSTISSMKSIISCMESIIFGECNHLTHPWTAFRALPKGSAIAWQLRVAGRGWLEGIYRYIYRYISVYIGLYRYIYI